MPYAPRHGSAYRLLPMAYRPALGRLAQGAGSWPNGQNTVGVLALRTFSGLSWQLEQCQLETPAFENHRYEASCLGTVALFSGGESVD